MNKKPKIFTQDCGAYTNEILVLCGVEDKKQIFKYLKKVRAKVDFSKWVLENFDDWKNDIKGKRLAQVCWEDKEDIGKVLMHEIHHIVLLLAKQKGFLEELENQAYLFEYLFHSIRRKLSGVDEIK